MKNCGDPWKSNNFIKLMAEINIRWFHSVFACNSLLSLLFLCFIKNKIQIIFIPKLKQVSRWCHRSKTRCVCSFGKMSYSSDYSCYITQAHKVWDTKKYFINYIAHSLWMLWNFGGESIIISVLMLFYLCSFIFLPHAKQKTQVKNKHRQPSFSPQCT